MSETGLIAKSASCICVHPSLPIKGLKDFVALARARPRTINYGTPGVGTVGHLSIESFCVYSNNIPCGHARSPGEPQMVFAGESHMDMMARELSLDPADGASIAWSYENGRVMERRFPCLECRPSTATAAACRRGN